MTTVIRVGHLKYKINDDDHNPPHVHVEGLGATLRVNLLTLEPMDDRTKFSAGVLRRILEYVRDNRIMFLEEWEKKHGEEN